MALHGKPGPGRPRKTNSTSDGLPRYPKNAVPEGLVPLLRIEEATQLGAKTIQSLLYQNVFRPCGKTHMNTNLFNETECIDAIQKHLRAMEDAKVKPPSYFTDSAYSTEDALRVMKLLQAGAGDLVNVSLETGIDPRHVEVISRRFAKMTSGMWLPRKIVDQLEKLLLGEGAPQLTAGDDMLELVRALAKRVQETRTCAVAGCGEKRSAFCQTCAEKRAAKAPVSS